MREKIRRKIRKLAGRAIAGLFNWGRRKGLVVGWREPVRAVPQEEIREAVERIVIRITPPRHPRPTLVLRYNEDNEEEPFTAFEVQP